MMCGSCRVPVRPLYPSRLWWVAELFGWTANVGLFLFIGTLAPVILVLAAVPMLAAAAMVGLTHQHATAGPLCPICGREIVVPERRPAPRVVPTAQPASQLRA
jgi:hypothetical protein